MDVSKERDGRRASENASGDPVPENLMLHNWKTNVIAPPYSHKSLGNRIIRLSGAGHKVLHSHLQAVARDHPEELLNAHRGRRGVLAPREHPNDFGVHRGQSDEDDRWKETTRRASEGGTGTTEEQVDRFTLCLKLW